MPQNTRSNEDFNEILERPEIKTWRAILETKNIVFSILESWLQKEGFTVPRFQVMFYLYFEGPTPPSVIADKMSVSRGNITAFFKRMLADKLIKTVAGKSQARPNYALTTKGEREFEKIFPDHAERVTKLVLAMDADMIDHLKKIKRNAENLGKSMS